LEGKSDEERATLDGCGADGTGPLDQSDHKITDEEFGAFLAQFGRSIVGRSEPVFKVLEFRLQAADTRRTIVTCRLKPELQ
jgi:hypothetical protein